MPAGGASSRLLLAAATLSCIVACGSRASSSTISAPPPNTRTAPAKSAPASAHLEDDILEGYVTLVDFWSESCAACVVVAGHVAVAIVNDDRIIVRKVDVGDGTTDIALRYKVGTLPHWKIYDTRKRLRYQLIGSEVLRAPQLARELLTEP